MGCCVEIVGMGCCVEIGGRVWGCCVEIVVGKVWGVVWR